MKIRLLCPTAAIPTASAGEIVEVDAKLGNGLACRGIASVVQHDQPELPAPAPGPRDVRPSVVKRAEIKAAQKPLGQERDGRPKNQKAPK